jgi:hypothetical protein
MPAAYRFAGGSTPSMIPYVFASSADMKLSRSVSRATRSSGWPVCCAYSAASSSRARRILGVEEQELRDDHVRDVVFDLAAEEHDAVLEQAREHVPAALAAVGLLDDGRDHRRARPHRRSSLRSAFDASPPCRLHRRSLCSLTLIEGPRFARPSMQAHPAASTAARFAR